MKLRWDGSGSSPTSLVYTGSMGIVQIPAAREREINWSDIHG